MNGNFVFLARCAGTIYFDWELGMLVRIAFVLFVGVFSVDQALAIKASGKVSVAAFGQDCGELTGGHY